MKTIAVPVVIIHNAASTAAAILKDRDYNFVKRHNTLRCTPAMAAGIERDFWSAGELLEAVA
jgi:hypothetical protein